MEHPSSVPAGVDPTWLAEQLTLLAQFRAVEDWANANALQDRLRPLGVNTSLRWKNTPPKQKSEREPGDSLEPWSDNLRHDSEYGARHRGLLLLSPDTLLASTPGWRHAPRLDKFKRVPKRSRFQVGKRLGLSLRALVLQQQQQQQQQQKTRPKPKERTVVVVEKAYLEGFLAGMTGADGVDEGSSSCYDNSGKSGSGVISSVGGGDGSSSVGGGGNGSGGGGGGGGGGSGLPAVSVALVLVNGGDAPVTLATMERLRCLPWLAVCFATNLHTPPDPARFWPLPLGVMPNNKATAGEAAVRAVRARALPWRRRDRRLLVPPMAASSRSRRDWARLLAQPEYAALVVTWPEGGARLGFEAFLALLAAHRAVLSPPGRGYDCFRTWQALAVGSVPLVARDLRFDGRLFEGTGAAFLPPLEGLTPAALEEALGALADPADAPGFGDCVGLEAWRARLVGGEETATSY